MFYILLLCTYLYIYTNVVILFFYVIKYEKNNIILSLSHIMILFISSIHNWLFYKKKIETFLLYYFQIWVFKHYICFPFSWFHVEQPVNNNNTLKNTKSYICMGPIIGRNDILHTKKRSMF